MERHDHLLEFAAREPFRERLPGESAVAYNQARAEAMLDLALRRTHQLHSGLTVVMLDQELMRTTLIGDPRIPGSGALGALTAQVAEVKSAQDGLHGTITAAIHAAAEQRDLHVYRSLRKYLVIGIGGLVITVILAAVLTHFGLQPPATPVSP